MPTYRVDVSYDMGMSEGGETHVFEATDDEAAKKYIREHEGDSLSHIKRDLRFNEATLARVVA